MVAIAKLFKNGQSQAIRLPKEFRFENQNEVIDIQSKILPPLIKEAKVFVENNFKDTINELEEIVEDLKKIVDRNQNMKSILKEIKINSINF